MVKCPAIGIDLGTSSSRIGVWQKNHVEIIPNELGKRKTPSYVSFTNSECLVGDRAFYQVGKNYKNTVFDIKRLIGRDFNDLNIYYDEKYRSFKVIEKDKRAYILIESKNETKNITPIELYSMILTKMKETAENYLCQSVSDAVITVPAYFNNAQRIATMKAAAIAGLNVLQIINEPTAAALAYGFNKKINREENLLIVDLGGGTFDVTLLTINNHSYKVKATAGDTHLGGEDFTNRLIDYFVNEFKEKYEKDPSTNPKSLRRLRIECEKIKISLTSFTDAQIDIDYLYDDIDFSSSITRSCFEKISSDLFDKIENTIKLVIDDSGLDKSEINEIILVGGSTRIPKVRNIITTLFDNKEINKTVDVDEAVTYGAAIQAFLLSGETEISEQIKDITISDVVSHSTSIRCIDDRENIIKYNSSIPKEKRIEWTIPSNQDSISFKIYEGKNQLLKDNYLLNEVIINKKSSLSSTIKINITFSVDINGILNFSVDDYHQLKKIISINSKNKMLNSDEIERIKQNALEKIKDKEKENERIKCMNQLDEYVFKLKTITENEKNIYVIPLDDIKDISNSINNTIEWIKDNQNASKEDYEQKKNELTEIHNHFKELYSHYHKLHKEKYDEKEKERIECKNCLVKNANDFKVYIENEKNRHGIPLEDINNINNSINEVIMWIKNNQNSSKEDYDKKNYELIEIQNYFQKLYSQYHKEIYDEKEMERIKFMNYINKYAYKLKAYIEKENNTHGIPPDLIKDINSSINDIIEWIKDNQDASVDDYEKKKNELIGIHNLLKQNAFEKIKDKEKENERIKCMNQLGEYANKLRIYIENEKNTQGIPPDVIKSVNNSINDTIEWIKDNQNATKEDFEKKNNELIEVHNHLKELYSHCHKSYKENYDEKEKERIEYMNYIIKYANNLKSYIENEKYMYGTSQEDINNINNSINDMIKWIKDNQIASKEEYEKKNYELIEIHNHLQKLYKNDFKEYFYIIKAFIENNMDRYEIPPAVKKYTNNFIKYMNEWRKYYKDASIDDYKKNKNKLHNCVNDIIEWDKVIKDANKEDSKKYINNFKIKYNRFKKKIKTAFGNYNDDENERIKSMNDLVEFTYDLKMYIEDERNFYGISPDDIKNLTDNISKTIKWMKNNRNASKEDYYYYLNMLSESENSIFQNEY